VVPIRREPPDVQRLARALLNLAYAQHAQAAQHRDPDREAVDEGAEDDVGP